MAQAPNTVDLDEHLKEVVVNVLHRTVAYAMLHIKDPKIADKAIRDCKEILSIVWKKASRSSSNDGLILW